MVLDDWEEAGVVDGEIGVQVDVRKDRIAMSECIL
jgi:hypothetical protein